MDGMPVSMTFGERVRKEREAIGLSQNELARKSGLNQPTLLKIEKGRTEDPGVSLAVPIARALGKTVEELLEGVPAPNAQQRPVSAPLARSVEGATERRRAEMLDADATRLGKLPFRDPWPAIRALEKAMKEAQGELRGLRAPASPPRKRRPGKRRTA